jgi:hypothetical protein
MDKDCKQCGGKFEITSSDERLYEKVAPVFAGKKFVIVMPEYCPDCREMHRLAFRNESTLYKRKCDLTGEMIVSTYSVDSPFMVYSQEAFWSDKWNALDYGRDFDFKRPFFEQFAELMKVVPRLSIVNKQSENSDYCNYSFANKNCYLLFGSHYEEDCLYGGYSTKDKNCVDYFWLYGSELCYESAFCSNCYKCIFTERSEQCSECSFCYDLKGCKNCLFSSGLRNKQYYIFNEQKTKEQYFAYLNSLKMSSYVQLEKLKEGWNKYRKENVVFRDVYQVNCQNCEGSNHQNSKNLKSCFSCTDCEDCNYGFQMDRTYSSIDCNQMGYDRCELCYNVCGNNGTFHGFCEDSCWHCSDIFYSNLCFSSRNCFGCIGMRQNEYCILNKQYSKEEYEKLVAKIVEKMIETEEWSKFFPAQLRPFAYNESVAQEFMPMKKSEVLALDWQWKDEESRGEKSAVKYEISDEIGDVKDDILEKVLVCEATGKSYKITPQELKFYRQMDLPVPRTAPKERLSSRFKFKAQCKFVDRNCSKCGKGIRTVYGSSYAKKVYCEECYLKVVY